MDRLDAQRALVAEARARAREFYVVDAQLLGPFTYDEALRVQDQENARYGIAPDGEGYCNAIVLHVSHAKAAGFLTTPERGVK